MKLKDKKIDILAVTNTKDSQGFSTETLTPISPPLWAYYRQLSGKEIFASSTTTATETAEFIINHRTDITTRHIVKFRGNLYDITRIDDFQGYKTDITLFCTIRGNAL